ncbi:MAG: HD domain-containing protein [Oscillospiraceae bacterium]
MPEKDTFRQIENCIMGDEAPSEILRDFAQQPWFGTFPFSLLLAEIKTEQSPVHHPEGNVWNHTLMVVDEAAKRKQFSTAPREFMWAALLHDIGKPPVTRARKGKITAYDHDREGYRLAGDFLSALTDETDFIENVMWLVRYHMQVLYVTHGLPFQDIPGMRAHTDSYDVALLGYCDRLGRTGADADAERRSITLFLEKCHESDAVPWLK